MSPLESLRRATLVLCASLAALASEACTSATPSDASVVDSGAETTSADANDESDLVEPVADASSDVTAFDPDALLAPGAVTYPASGPIAGDAGRGSFTFGVATAATQIEDQNPSTDWYAWTTRGDGGLGRGTAFVGDAVQGYSRWQEDLALVEELSLDSYRFSIEWARVEPERDRIDEEALAHYGMLLDRLRARRIRPLVTVHHFSNPLWVDDPRRRTPCVQPSDRDLCGFDHPQGADQIIEELAEHAALLARRFGDRVDEWGTLNEPVNYLLASYGLEEFPPGRNLLTTDVDRFVSVYRNYLRAHVAIYDAIKANDTVDADGDGVAAHVGLSLSVAEWVPARSRRVSSNPVDVAARDRVDYVYKYLVVSALLDGAFDPDLDGTAQEPQPTWRGKLDWLGLQYYFRAGVSGDLELIPRVRANVCFGRFRVGGACLPPLDPSKWIETMNYEFYEPGIYNILRAFSQRYPRLPLTVSEAGIAANNGRRRAENIVRILEQIERARREGVDVRGYYHWSLMDNFEWAEGFTPRFGLYRVDRTRSPYTRTATEGATVLRDIARARMLAPAQRAQYGGLGPMTAETP